MPPQRLAEQPLAVAVAVREGGVEEVAAERHGPVERGQRLRRRPSPLQPPMPHMP